MIVSLQTNSNFFVHDFCALIGRIGPIGPIGPIPPLPTPCQHPPCGHLHELRSAVPSPWQSVRSTRSPSLRCRLALPSPLPPATTPLPSRPWCGSRTAVDNQ